MKFLVISQRAIGSPEFSLKDLPGHGRFDIIPRCILAASRPLATQIGYPIAVFLKGGEYGWIEWNNFDTLNEDEVSLAAIIQQTWDKIFHQGSLSELLDSIEFKRIILLNEQGDNLSEIMPDEDDLLILGAQQDLKDEDISLLESHPYVVRLSLGDESMLASQAIVYLRQLLL
ncbi:MAG: hypothetical protein INQ03_05100 [Candidatus Heimdallarchaeota archaeon]|nr:hypothetical protein [Candidatus Heimdallarchaeota archaeon]